MPQLLTERMVKTTLMNTCVAISRGPHVSFIRTNGSMNMGWWYDPVHSHVIIHELGIPFFFQPVVYIYMDIYIYIWHVPLFIIMPWNDDPISQISQAFNQEISVRNPAFWGTQAPWDARRDATWIDMEGMIWADLSRKSFSSGNGNIMGIVTHIFQRVETR